MLVSFRHGFVFLCTPKNASNSIEAMLRPYAELDVQHPAPLRHLSLKQYQDHLAPLLRETAGAQELETVALIRDPIAWLDSWYRFRARSRLLAKHPERSTSGLSFEQFLAGYLEQPRPGFADFEPASQYEFLQDANGQVGVDRIFPYERIELLVEHFSRVIEKPLRLPTLNVSPKRVGASRTRRRLEEWFQRLHYHVGLRRQRKIVQAPPPEVPPALRARLEERMARDFAIHRQALADGQYRREHSSR